MANIAIIGAGMGGMACAARLSAKGHIVTIYEASSTWGGKLGQQTFAQHRFDTGPSLLTLPAVYRDLFLKTGRPLEDSIEIVELDRAFRYQFADGSVLELPGAGIGKCATAIGDAFGGTSADEWRKFMDRAAKMWAVTRRPFLESPLNGMRSLLAMSWRVNDLATIAPTKTLRALATKYFTDPRLVTLVDRYATYSGSDPRKAPAALATIPYIEQTFGAHHVAGGLRELGQALFERCQSLGLNFYFNSPVISVSKNADKFVVEIAGLPTATHDIVVANADAHFVYHQLLDQSLPAVKRAQKSLAKVTPSLSGFVLNLALTGKTPQLAHHNVFFPADYDDEFDSVFGKNDSVFGKARKPRPTPKPAIYICNPQDAQMAPSGDESWFVLINAPRHEPETGVDWTNEELVAGYSQDIIDQIGLAGFDLSSRIKWQDSISPAQLADRTGAYGGSIYGSSSNGMRAAFLRPRNVSEIENFYLVGGSVHPGGGLPLVAISADIVAQKIGRA
ncbi:MAG: phytoene desaturase [Actinomycetales bacterium]|nr:phytoene desaturase [Actinomycetales bacterium]